MKTLRTMAAVRRELRRLIEPAVDDKQHELWRRQGDAIADAFRPLQMSDKVTEHLVRRGLMVEARQVLETIRDERRPVSVVPLKGSDAAFAAELTRRMNRALAGRPSQSAAVPSRDPDLEEIPF
jgi:hypothetical protein